jgi:DNA-binding HxlR family transcriptional regulator
VTRLEPGGTNPLGIAFGLLGDEWTLMLLRHALLGAKRYSDFSAALPISYAVLTTRLDLLVREQLMEKVVYQQNPVRAEYVLTEKGRGVWPILTAIWGWERRWVDEHTYDTPPMHHETCGRDFTPAYACKACGERVSAHDLVATWGPSGGWQRSVPETRTRRRSHTRDRAVQTFYPDTMAVFGNRWSSAVVGAAFMGITRFTDFQDVLGAPPSLLADRLASLCEREILQRVELEGRTDWAEYKLTAKGIDFFPVIGVTLEWGEHWYRAEGKVLKWRHRVCRRAFTGVLVCDQCDQPLVGSEITLSPGAPAARA